MQTIPSVSSGSDTGRMLLILKSSREFRAFEVDDLDAALIGHKVIIQPNSPSIGVMVAFIEVNGAPVELMQIDRNVRTDL